MRRRRALDRRGRRSAQIAEAARRVAGAARRGGQAAGGLHIIGTERHESRRIDNQLRGRSGRQGDPGSSRFYLSLEDPLMRIFAGDRVAAIMERLKMPEGEAIEDPHRHALDRERAAQGRGAQLRHPQAPARVRRRRQRPAQGDLPAAQRAPRGRATSRTTIAQHARRRRRPTSSRSYVPPEVVEEQWDLPGSRRRCASEWQLDAAARPSGSKAEPELDDEDAASSSVAAGRGRRRSTRKVAQVGAEHVRASSSAACMLQTLDHALARAPGRARLPAPGHPPARLRAEESEAGIQARGVRAVRRDARRDQARRRQASC